MIFGDSGVNKFKTQGIESIKQAASKGNDDVKEFIDVYREILWRAKNILNEAKRPFSL